MITRGHSLLTIIWTKVMSRKFQVSPQNSIYARTFLSEATKFPNTKPTHQFDIYCLTRRFLLTM